VIAFNLFEEGQQVLARVLSAEGIPESNQPVRTYPKTSLEVLRRLGQEIQELSL
jgi:hypothetical protein